MNNKEKIRNIIKNEIINELQYYDKDNIGQAINYKLEELESALKSVKNPEVWAEKYARTARTLIDTLDKVINVLEKIK